MIDWERKTKQQFSVESQKNFPPSITSHENEQRRKNCQLWNAMLFNRFHVLSVALFPKRFFKVENKKQHDAIGVVAACFSILRIMCVIVKIMAKEIQSYLQNATNKK